MRRLLCFVLFVSCAVTLSAQKHPFGSTIERTLDLLGQGRTADAYSFWNDNTKAYKTDSLYIWASAVIAQNFMESGCFAESEALFNNADQALNHLKSDSIWWFEQLGYLSTRKSLLYITMHDYHSARTCASVAKNAFECISNRGLEYAYALAVLSAATLVKGHYVLARTFVGQAFSIAYQIFTTQFEKDKYSYFSYIAKETGIIDLSLGYYETAIKSFELLKELNRQIQYDDPYIDFYLGSAYVNAGYYDKAVAVLTPFYSNCSLLQLRISSGINLLYAKYKLGHDDIVPLAYEIVKFQVENISRMFSFMSEQEKERWWMSNENSIISIADAILLQSGLKEVNGIIADNEIFSKGLLLRSSNMFKSAALGSNDESIVNSYYTLELLRGRLAETTDNIERASLEQEISILEKELQRKINISVDDVSSWKDVASSLNNKEIALEFVRFKDLNQTDEAAYYAIIVKKGCKEPQMIRLFDESALKKIIGSQGNKRIDKYITELYSTGAPQYKGEELYNLIWSALEKEIKGYSTIYYSLAGILNSISLQAISNGKQSLGQKYIMHLVSSIGEIPHIKNTSSNLGTNAVVYGGIQYDAEEFELIQASRSYSRGSSENWELGSIEVRSGWKRLPGTEVEAKEVGSILTNKGYTVVTISGIKANEESFKALSGKGISTIHIATHGFFLSEQKEIKKNAFLNPTMSDNLGRIDPMLRAGLLFAGANRAWTGKRIIDGIEDGILTAKEITALDFSKVKLIVLSACQTGLGDVEANEGVYGLQRAFKLAGAETLIMSLWEVDDKVTSILMKTFYEEYLNGKAKDVAFRSAINKVRSFKDTNGDTPFSSPYYWAAFIMLD